MSQRDQTTSIDSNFKRKAVRRQERINKQIDKNIIKAEDNDTEIINVAIELADDERNAMNKKKNSPKSSSREIVQHSNPQPQQQLHT